MDGRTELCSQNHAHRWSAWKTFNNTNSVNGEMKRHLDFSDLGFVLNDSVVEKSVPRVEAEQISANESTTSLGWVDLRELLPLLGSKDLTHLDTSTFKNLKIVIEWNNKLTELLTNTADAVEMVQPNLVVDVIEDGDLVNKMSSKMSNNINWMEIEHDSFIVPAISNAVNVPINVNNFRLNGFNNKTLGRILISKNLVDDTLLVNGNIVNSFGNMGSIAQTNEKINFVVNGRSLLVGQGLENENSKSAKLIDSWGDCNQIAGGNMMNINNSANLIDFGVGQLDYVGCYIGEKISDLQIAYGREGISNGAGATIQHAQLIVNVFGEVPKSLTMKGGEYNVSYLN